MVVRGKQDGGGRKLAAPVGCGQRPTSVGVDSRFDQKKRQSPTASLDDPWWCSTWVSGRVDGKGRGGPRHVHDQASRRFISETVDATLLPASARINYNKPIERLHPVTCRDKTLRDEIRDPGTSVPSDLVTYDG